MAEQKDPKPETPATPEEEIPAVDRKAPDETAPEVESGVEAPDETDAPAADDGDEPAAEEAPLSPEEELAGQRDEFEDKWLRCVAELDNLRKRSRREVADARRFATAEVLRPLLDVLDNFERAVGSFRPEEDEPVPDLAGLRDGIELILQSFRGVLESKGLRRIEAVGEDFDPRLHEAIGQLEVEGVESGAVAEVVQTGYTLDDMVLRPSRVMVAR